MRERADSASELLIRPASRPVEDSPTAFIGTGNPMLATQPGVSVEHVLENTGFELLQVDCMDQNPAQTAEEPWTLREEVDPDGLYN